MSARFALLIALRTDIQLKSEVYWEVVNFKK